MKRRVALVLALCLGLAGLVFAGASAPAKPPAKPPAGPSGENHFRCYIVSQQTPQPAQTVTLEDQFTTAPETVSVGEPVMFCPPAEKTIGGEVFPIEDEQQHYTLYTAPSEAAPRTVLVTDQFASEARWTVTNPKFLMVPTAKTIGGQTFDDRDRMNHYWCYEANGPRVGARVTLDDQFSGPDNVRVTTPTLLCNPVEKVHAGVTFRIEDRNLHLACYEIHGKQATVQFTFQVENQFETDQFQSGPWEILCAPAEKSLP